MTCESCGKPLREGSKAKSCLACARKAMPASSSGSIPLPEDLSDPMAAGPLNPPSGGRPRNPASRPSGAVSKPTPVPAEPAAPAERDLEWYEHAVAGLPLILLLRGGAVGGACGVAGYQASRTVFRSNLPTHLKYICSIGIGFGSFVAYVLVVILLIKMFPSLGQ